MIGGRKMTIWFWTSLAMVIVRVLIALEPRLQPFSDVINALLILAIAAMGLIAAEDVGRAMANRPANLQAAIRTVGTELVEATFTEQSEQFRATLRKMVEDFAKTLAPEPPPSSPPGESAASKPDLSLSNAVG